MPQLGKLLLRRAVTSPASSELTYIKHEPTVNPFILHPSLLVIADFIY